MLNEMYLRMPKSIQDLALTLYGYKQHRNRFYNCLPIEYKNINSVFEEDTLALKAQSIRVNKLLQHALSTVPYYKDFVLKNNLSVESIDSNNFTEILPVVRKSDIVKDPDKFITCDKKVKKNSFELYTSGSSGTPLRVLASRESRVINYYFYKLLLAEYGLEYRGRSVTLAGRVLYKEINGIADRVDYYNNTMYLSSYFISKENIGLYWRALNSWRPLFIDSYPSALIELIKLMKDDALTLECNPKLILTSSETLSEEDRKLIEDYFKCPVVDHYGCTEMAVSAFSKGSKYLVSPMYSKVEFVSIGSGIYRVLVTGLLNFCMPLIRYDIGDVIYARNPKNPYVFDRVEGRLDDLIITPEGRRVGRLDPAYKGISGIEVAQVVQHSLESIEIKIVLSQSGLKYFDENKLIDNFRNRTSKNISFRISYQDSIPKNPNGKFKSVVSLLKK